jgi:hypothetical protein
MFHTANRFRERHLQFYAAIFNISHPLFTFIQQIFQNEIHFHPVLRIDFYVRTDERTRFWTAFGSSVNSIKLSIIFFAAAPYSGLFKCVIEMQSLSVVWNCVTYSQILIYEDIVLIFT